MSELQDMPTRELCDELRELANEIASEMIEIQPPANDVVAEAARRLSRYAPIKIDPDDEGTWPTEEDGDEDGFVWAWLPVSEEWAIRTVGTVRGCGRVASPAYTYWKRIDNEPPEGE